MDLYNAEEMSPQYTKFLRLSGNETLEEPQD